MARQLRIHPPGGYHHVTIRGNNKQPIFIDDEDRLGFLRVLEDACRRNRCDLIAYCLMTNHVHLTLLDHHGDLSSVLRQLKSVYAQRFNQRHGRTGHLFEGRFWNSVLDTDSYLATAVEYVHRNPVEAGIVRRPEAYPWSSYQEYLGHRPALSVLCTEPVLALYSHNLALLDSSTQRAKRNERKEAELAKARPSPVLGTSAFKARMLAHTPTSSETASSRRRAVASGDRRDIAEIVAGVSAVHDVAEVAITTKLPGHAKEARACAIFLARCEGWPLADIARHFGLRSPSSVSMSCRRFRTALEDDADIEMRCRLAEQRLAVNC